LHIFKIKKMFFWAKLSSKTTRPLYVEDYTGPAADGFSEKKTKKKPNYRSNWASNIYKLFIFLKKKP
jgi:hypothetical protein